MKFLLYQTEMNLGNTKKLFHHGPLSIATYLRDRGHEVYYRTISDRDFGKEEFLYEIKRIDPSLIGFSIMTDEWIYAAKLAGWIKDQFKIPIIFGGAHATMAPKETIDNPNVDFVCRGEGEYAIEELCECMERGINFLNIENLWIRDGNKIHTNPMRPLIENLDDLPFPDHHFVDFQSLIDDNGAVMQFMVGRGCPFRCTYCINRGLHELYRGKGSIVRRRSIDHIINALIEIVSEYKRILCIEFDDDLFTLDKNWLREFCKVYGDKIGIPFTCYMRVEGIDREFLKILKNAGGVGVCVGVESGNEWLRKNILSRNMSNQTIINAFKLLDEFEIDVLSLNMIGLPFENKKMIEETIELNKRLKPTRLFATPFQPYPGTKLREICIKEGWLSEDNIQFANRNESILNFPEIKKEEIAFYTDKLNKIGFDIHIKKESLGIYDFLAHLSDADVEKGEGGDVDLAVFTSKDALTGHGYVLKACPPSKITYKLPVPEASFLDFSIGILQDPLSPKENGVLFIVDILHGLKFSLCSRIFQRYLNPKRNVKDRKWVDVELSLRDYSNQEVKISFITIAGPDLKNTSKLVGWKRPCITRISVGNRNRNRINEGHDECMKI